MYTVDCAPGQICAKSTIDDGFDENGVHRYVTGSRGCAMPNTSFGKVHELGCGEYKTNLIPPADTNQKFWDLICFCNYDYCNGVGINEASKFISYILILLLLKTCYMFQ